MANGEKIKLVIDGVQALAVVLGLGFAYDQAKKLTDSIAAANKGTALATWNSVAQQWVALDKIFVDKPDLNKYFYDKADPSTADPKETLQVNAMGQYFLYFIDNALIVGNYLRDTDITHLPEWKISFDYIFTHSPVICQIYKLDASSYSSYTQEFATQHNCIK